MTPETRVLDSSTVLLVGANDWVVRLAETLEGRTDATVTRVRTKAEALDAVRERSPDCLVSEYALERETGIDLLRAVRDETATL
ncbi:hypothetical protein DJ71_04985, partial [Halorubrum sp. E3]